MYIAVILALTVACVPAFGFQNSWDGQLFVTCPPNQLIYRVYSVHDNGKEDRRWRYYCKPFYGATIGNGVWSGYVNEYDDLLTYRCRGNAVISGVLSVHKNHYEDRRFNFRCSTISKPKSNCHFTKFINNWDGVMNYSVPSNYVIVGFSSSHDNHKEDRRWKVEICKCT